MRIYASHDLDDYKVFPRLMMLVVTILTYQSVHWYMALDNPTIQQSGLVSVCMGGFNWLLWNRMNGERKNDTNNR